MLSRYVDLLSIWTTNEVIIAADEMICLQLLYEYKTEQLC